MKPVPLMRSWVCKCLLHWRANDFLKFLKDCLIINIDRSSPRPVECHSNSGIPNTDKLFLSNWTERLSCCWHKHCHKLSCLGKSFLVSLYRDSQSRVIKLDYFIYKVINTLHTLSHSGYIIAWFIKPLELRYYCTWVRTGMGSLLI